MAWHHIKNLLCVWFEQTINANGIQDFQEIIKICTELWTTATFEKDNSSTYDHFNKLL